MWEARLLPRRGRCTRSQWRRGEVWGGPSTESPPCDTLEPRSQTSFADVGRTQERSAPTFNGLSAPRRRRRRLCGGRVSGASLARWRIDEHDRRPRSATRSRSSTRSKAPALAPRRSTIEVPSAATLIVDRVAFRRHLPAEDGRDRRGGCRVAKERLLRRHVSRAELVVAAVVDGWLAGWPRRHLYACGRECEYLFRTVIDSTY